MSNLTPVQWLAVQLDSRFSEKKEVKVNCIASMYGKEKIVSLLSHPMLYWDKAKARIWMQAYRLQLPAQVLPKRASGRKILKPADLVKYKKERNLSFSLTGAGAAGRWRRVAMSMWLTACVRLGRRIWRSGVC